MDRSKERLIDVAVLGMLLLFAYLMREADRALAGVIVASAVQFWMAKNATGPSAAEIAAKELAKAAAEQLQRAQDKAAGPDDPKAQP